MKEQRVEQKSDAQRQEELWKFAPSIPSPRCLTEPLQTPPRARCLGFQRRRGLDEFPLVNKLRGTTVAVTTRRPGRRGEHRRDQ